MLKQKKPSKGLMSCNEYYHGETIEAKLRRVMLNKEPIEDGAPIVYTERKDGVRFETNIRSDRFDFAIEKMAEVTEEKLKKRANLKAIKGGDAPQGEEPQGGAGTQAK